MLKQPESSKSWFVFTSACLLSTAVFKLSWSTDRVLNLSLLHCKAAKSHCTECNSDCCDVGQVWKRRHFSGKSLCAVYLLYQGPAPPSIKTLLLRLNSLSQTVMVHLELHLFLAPATCSGLWPNVFLCWRSHRCPWRRAQLTTLNN